jgi:hypothetical protein
MNSEKMPSPVLALYGASDAFRLLLAVAGSQLVKNSKATLDGFRKLQPIAYAKRPAEPGERPSTLESHLVQLMERLVTARNDLPAVYVRGPGRGSVRVSLSR